MEGENQIPTLLFLSKGIRT